MEMSSSSSLGLAVSVVSLVIYAYSVYFMNYDGE